MAWPHGSHHPKIRDECPTEVHDAFLSLASALMCGTRSKALANQFGKRLSGFAAGKAEAKPCEH